MNNAKRACGLMLILSAACMLSTGYLIINSEVSAFALRFLCIVPLYALLVWVLNFFLLKKERSLTLLFVIGLAESILCLVPCYFAGIMNGAVSVILAAAMAVAPAALAPYLNLTPPKLSQCILIVEAALVLLLLEGLILPYRNSSAGMYVWGILAVCTAMLCLLLYRMEGTVTLRTILMLTGLFAALAAVAALLLWGGAAAAGGGLVSLWQGIVGAFAKLGRLLEAAAQWIAAMFHPEELDEGMEIDLEQGVITEAADSTGETVNIRIGILAVVILVVLLAAVIFLVLHLFGRVRVGGTGAQRQQSGRSRKSLGEILGRKLRAFRTKLAVSHWLRQNRNMPVGIFYLMEKKCRRSGLARRTEDTPADFLRRLAQALEPEYADAVLALIPAVNREIFGGAAADKAVPGAGQLLRKAGAAAGKNRLQHQKTKKQTGS